jgi:hypothetical protein
LNSTTQFAPIRVTTTLVLLPTSWLHAAAETPSEDVAVTVAACANGAVKTEMPERVEITNRNGINEATLRRTMRMKSALLTAIPMYSFFDLADR